MRVRAIVSVAILVSMLTAMAVATRAEEPLRRTVTVSAQSVIQVTPDEVVINLEVETLDKDISAAKIDNDKRTQGILALGKKYRLAQNAVKINDFSVDRKYDRPSYSEFIGYRVRRLIEFVLSDFNDLDSLISDAFAAGATGLDGILLRTTKHLEHQWEARRKAVAIAKEKAGHLAELNGLALGMAIEIEEGVEGDDHTDGMGGMFGDMADKERSQAKIHFVGAAKEKIENISADAAKPQTNTALGEIAVRATVHVTFELKEPST